MLCALAQYSYWFLAVRADLNARRGDIGALKGLRISSSTAFPEVGLRHLLRQTGIDVERDRVSIVPLPATKDEHLKYRVGVEAIEQNIADAYWGNGMRLAIGEKLGVAKLHLDLRRGDGPLGARFYNFAALTTTERLIEQQPQVAAGAVRAIVKAQSRAQSRSVARHADRPTFVRAGSGFADRRPRRTRCAVLRRDDFGGSRRRHQRFRDGQWTD